MPWSTGRIDTYPVPASRPWLYSADRLRSTRFERSVPVHTRSTKSGPGRCSNGLRHGLAAVLEQGCGLVAEQLLDGVGGGKYCGCHGVSRCVPAIPSGRHSLIYPGPHTSTRSAGAVEYGRRRWNSCASVAGVGSKGASRSPGARTRPCRSWRQRCSPTRRSSWATSRISRTSRPWRGCSSTSGSPSNTPTRTPGGSTPATCATTEVDPVSAGGCAVRSCSSARWWRARVRRASPNRAATTSACAGWSSTSKDCASWAPRSRSARVAMSRAHAACTGRASRSTCPPSPAPRT